MDAVTINIKQDSIRSAAMLSVLVLFFVLMLDPSCPAQQLGIRSRDKSQLVIHDLIHNDQIFSEVQWDIHNSFQNQGVAVVWTAGPFQISSGSRSDTKLADTGLSIRIQNSGPKNAWKLAQALDVTNVAKGDNSAMVSAVSNQHSEATFGITVLFRNNATTIPAAGRYETLLIGTITSL